MPKQSDSTRKSPSPKILIYPSSDSSRKIPTPPKNKQVAIEVPMQKEEYWSSVEDSHRSRSAKIEELTNTKDLWIYKNKTKAGQYCNVNRN